MSSSIKPWRAAGDHQPQDEQGTKRLDRHGQLGPPGERHHIGRAERGGVGEAEVQVVGELGTPAGRGHDRVELLGEGQVRELRRGPQARIRAASVEDPVQEGEGKNGVEPDPETDAQQIGGVIGLRAAAHQIQNQPGSDPGCLGHQHRDQRDGQRPDGGRPAATAAAVGGRDGHQEHGIDRRDHPAGAQAEPRGEQQRDDDRQDQRARQWPAFFGPDPGPHHLNFGDGPAGHAHLLAGPPVTGDGFGLRGGGRPPGGVGFGDQGAGGVQRRRHFLLIAVGWHADHNPGPVRSCLSLHRHLRGPGQPLIAPEPFAAHLPGQRHPHHHLPVRGGQFNI